MLTFSVVSSGSAQNTTTGFPVAISKALNFFILERIGCGPYTQTVDSSRLSILIHRKDCGFITLDCPLSPDKDHASISRFHGCELVAVSVLFVCWVCRARKKRITRELVRVTSEDGGIVCFGGEGGF